MNQHTPQEWADWTGCCVAQDEDEGFWMFPDKPKIDLISKCWEETDDFCICIPEELVEIPDDHKWTHLYEPRKARTEYMLIEESDPDRLAANVTRMLKDGWNLYGSPFTSPGGRFGFFYYQAMIRGKSYEQDV